MQQTQTAPLRATQSENGPARQATGRGLPLPVTLFLISLILPFLFPIGPLLMSANRLLLTVMVVYCTFAWLQGRAGPIRTADIMLFLFCLWIMISLIRIEGMSVAIEASGIRFIETLGPYLIARCFIRSAEDFRATVALLFWIIVLMLPFGIVETITGYNVLIELAAKVCSLCGDVPMKQRWGLDRVQGVFQHPILFGIFCGTCTGLVYYVLGYQASSFKRWFKTGLTVGTAGLSLSAGPLTAVIAQLLLIGWHRVMFSVRRRWAVLVGGIVSAVVAIEIAANRSAAEIFISYFAFSKWTASNRLRIWEYGSASVLEHPIFGIGRGEWERPYYMSSSMDMFWLVPAVRNGLPAALLLQLAMFSLLLTIALRSGLTERASRYRMGYVVCIVGLYLGGWTVDYWKVIYVFFFFLLGSGVWILDAAEKPGELAEKVCSDREDATDTENARPRQLLDPTGPRRPSTSHRRRAP